MSIGLGEALSGGLVSIYTPCAGVIVPAFLAHVAGLAVLAQKRQRRWFDAPVASGTVSFVLGFGAVFVLLGSPVGPIASWVQGSRDIISQAGGAVVILFGVLVMGVVPLPKNSGGKGATALEGGKLIASFMVGVAFAIGWTPCVNDELGRILTLAQQPGSSGEGAGKLSVYSLGLMAPFLAAGLAGGLVGPRLRDASLVRRGVGVLAGVALVMLGALVFTDRFVELTGYLFRLTA